MYRASVNVLLIALQGDLRVAWGLLWHLREAFPAPPSAVTKSASHRTFHAYTRLGYSLGDQRRLKRSLLSWLFSIGAISTE